MDTADRAILRRFGAERLGLDVPDEIADRIGRFIDALRVWNRRIRLTGERDDGLLVQKHVADSLACVTLMPESGPVLDLGSGSGFPGMVIACARPALAMTLLDSRQKAVSFLREAIRAADVPLARAVAMRAEDAARDETLAGRQLVVTSRAIRMEEFLGLAGPLRAPGGLLVAMQTPKTSHEEAINAGRAHGVDVSEIRDYELPTGEPRRLIAWR